MSDPKAELAIKKLARLPANTICPNCGTEKKFGFSTICMKYKTFVCNMCKAGHTAISHRCKSLTMSSWTAAEVHSLTEAGGGGNDIARRTWLANAPPIGTGGRPREGDDVNVFKRFVVQVSEERRYWAEDAGAAAPPVAAPAPRPMNAAAAAPVKRVPARAPAPVVPAPAPAPDLLDFGAFESAPTPAAAAAAPTAAPVPEPAVADFGAFESAPAPVATAPAPAAATSASSFSPNFDAFGGSDPFATAGSAATTAGPPPAPQVGAAAQSGFGFIANGPTSAPPAVATAPEQPKVKKPIMSMGGGGGNAAMISNIGSNAGVGAMNSGGMNMMMGGQMGYNHNMAMSGGGGMNNMAMNMNDGGVNNPMMNMNGGYMYNHTQQAQMMMGGSQGMMMQQMPQQQMGFGTQGTMQQGGYGGNGMAQKASTSASGVRDPFDSLFDGKK